VIKLAGGRSDQKHIGFVRVRRRTLKGGSSATTFDLLRSVRVDGAPRHQFVLTLGTQRSDRDAARFWPRAPHGRARLVGAETAAPHRRNDQEGRPADKGGVTTLRGGYAGGAIKHATNAARSSSRRCTSACATDRMAGHWKNTSARANSITESKLGAAPLDLGVEIGQPLRPRSARGVGCRHFGFTTRKSGRPRASWRACSTSASRHCRRSSSLIINSGFAVRSERGFGCREGNSAIFS
jgi:hypothetical protein